jgi:Flp pilus assembly protein TadG
MSALRLRSRHKGQALLELGLIMPVLLIFSMTVTQLGILFLTYLSVMDSSRDIARWVVVHPHVTDATTIAQVKSRLPANLNPNNLTVAMSPACAALVNGKCPNRNVGDRITFTLTYDATPVIFLPSQFRIGSLQTQVPTNLPPYTMYMMVETR